jgi:phage shock protein PspC (stress-responsive transcriptional regulator)
MEAVMEKRLYRSRKWRVFGGVAGGLAEYFGLDPILMRVIFVIITLINGIGILLYIILWIVIPEIPFEIAYQVKPEDQPLKEGTSDSINPNVEVKSNGKGRIFVGAALIIIGILFFFERFIPSFNFEDFFPALLIIIGLALIWNSAKKRGI